MRRWLLTIVLTFAFVVALFVLIGWFVSQRMPPGKDFGVLAAALGDVAGSLFSALAFAGLIVTAFMQREELSLQREELRETRAELKRSTEAQQGAERALEAQVAAAEVAAKLNSATALFAYHREETDRIIQSRETGKTVDFLLEYHQAMATMYRRRIVDVLGIEEVVMPE